MSGGIVAMLQKVKTVGLPVLDNGKVGWTICVGQEKSYWTYANLTHIKETKKDCHKNLGQCFQ